MPRNPTYEKSGLSQTRFTYDVDRKVAKVFLIGTFCFIRSFSLEIVYLNCSFCGKHFLNHLLTTVFMVYVHCVYVHDRTVRVVFLH